MSSRPQLNVAFGLAVRKPFYFSGRIPPLTVTFAGFGLQ
jgi:hypothetical protein